MNIGKACPAVVSSLITFPEAYNSQFSSKDRFEWSVSTTAAPAAAAARPPAPVPEPSSRIRGLRGWKCFFLLVVMRVWDFACSNGNGNSKNNGKKNKKE